MTHRRQTTTHPDRRAVMAARDLDTLGPVLAMASEHLARELRALDGAPAAQALSDGDRSTDQTTTVEATVLAREERSAALHALDGQMGVITDGIRRMFALCREVMASRRAEPVAEPLTCYSDPGLAGYLVSLDDGGWFDPLCDRPPRSSTGGQCDPCRKRHERWRERNGEPPLKGESLEFDSTTIIHANGVAHTRSFDAA